MLIESESLNVANSVTSTPKCLSVLSLFKKIEIVYHKQ